MATDISDDDEQNPNPPPRLALHSYVLKAIKQASLESRIDNESIPQGYHLLIGLIKEPNGNAGMILRGQGFTPELVRKKATEFRSQVPLTAKDLSDLDQIVLDTMDIANELAIKAGASLVETSHVLQGLIRADTLELNSICQLPEISTDIDALEQEALSAKNEEKVVLRASTPGVSLHPIGDTLQSFGRNLTKMAIENKLSPVIGRQKEIERAKEILARRTKSNPLLIGPAGAGKTAIVEGLAQSILEDSADDRFRSMQIIEVTLADLVAGTKFRGEFEQRIKQLLKEAESNPDVVLFIDELHTILMGGGGGVDAANMLKPGLANGSIHCIGATTNKEARQLLSDEALERRFQTIKIDALNRAQTIEVLTGLKETYQKYHGVNISKAVIEAAVDGSGRYISNRIWPDSALDLIDEASVRAKINNKGESAIHVTPRQVAEVISMQTKIPVGDIIYEEGQHLLQAEEKLHQDLIGQNKAVEQVSKALRRSRAGLRDPRRPVGAFLFVGPTGVGKTHLAKILARYMFGESDSLIRIDMSEFQDAHMISRLIGAPPGYVGSDEGGKLTEAISRHPYSIVLLDEFEKAHPSVSNLFLGLLDSGKIKDSKGKVVDCSNTIVIMTSNIGNSANNRPSIGFNQIESEVDRKTMRAVTASFPPELLGRLQIIEFSPLTLSECLTIANLEVSNFVKMVKKQHKLNLDIDQAGVAKLVQDSDYKTYGARSLRRKIYQTLEEPLSNWILHNHNSLAGRSLSWSLVDNEYNIKEISSPVVKPQAVVELAF